MSPEVRVRRIQPEDWQQYKSLRLQMLAEIPIAFGETLATALARTDREWRARVGNYAAESNPRLGAVEDVTGRWVGTMGGVLDRGRPTLVGVYVEPARRGRAEGVTDALLTVVEDWARAHSDTLLLQVHENNARARAAYASRGFEPTGVLTPYPLDRSHSEIQMAKRL